LSGFFFAPEKTSWYKGFLQNLTHYTRWTDMKLRYLLASSLLFLSAATFAEESSALAVSVGAFDVGKDETAAEIGLEYRFAPMQSAYNIIPVVGVSGTSDGSTWAYGGIRYDIDLGENWVLTPNFAASVYRQGGGKDLGHALEFRSGLEIAYKLNENSHLGLALYHMSNASIGDKNPGQESVILSYSFSPDF
jgi:hypothetical protein